MGVVVWPMVELEADDALASAARLASADPEVEKVCIWTVDKDLAQCVRGERVVQVDRRAKKIHDEAGVRAKFGVGPALIPDYLALVGDAADGYPGVAGIGSRRRRGCSTATARSRIFRPTSWASAATRRSCSKSSPRSAPTLRSSARSTHCGWRGAKDGFAGWTARMDAPGLLARCAKLQESMHE